MSAVVVEKYDLRLRVPAVVIVPPLNPVPPVIEVTEPVPQVEHATVMGTELNTEAPAVTVMTPEPEMVFVAVV